MLDFRENGCPRRREAGHGFKIAERKLNEPISPGFRKYTVEKIGKRSKQRHNCPTQRDNRESFFVPKSLVRFGGQTEYQSDNKREAKRENKRLQVRSAIRRFTVKGNQQRTQHCCRKANQQITECIQN